jgi:hypothetical protein
VRVVSSANRRVRSSEHDGRTSSKSLLLALGAEIVVTAAGDGIITQRILPPFQARDHGAYGLSENLWGVTITLGGNAHYS